MKGPRGWVFRGVDVEAAPGSLIAVEGPSGSGRTCLLLALTGRMKPTAGHAEVDGHRLPKKMGAVRRLSALGPVPGVTDLDPSLTVAEQLRERALLQRRYDGPVRALLRPRGERVAGTARRIDEALAAVGLDVEALPKGARTSVRDLERLEELRLSLALALMSQPRLVAVDDTDLKLSDAERAEAWALLRSLADRGTTVLAVCSEAPEGAVVVRTAAAPDPSARPVPGAAPAVAAGADPEPAAAPAAPAADADTDPEPGSEPEPEPTTKPDPEPATDPEPEPATESEPNTESEPDSESEPKPDSDPESTTDPAIESTTVAAPATAARPGSASLTKGDRKPKTRTTVRKGTSDALA
ncbi:ATP-binding cassette domain-containing protein [Streptomyces sp. NRRL S-87]|uniref:ABC transporter ATP-binding protein n=1 Tax=Streptomyces sp. NRRL S-87 TaxID=1463920 RepID=UPI001F1D8DDF|nr:ATP-binding cassette domain-containing protein [Streptomyces sp. NRRL S-87]